MEIVKVNLLLDWIFLQLTKFLPPKIQVQLPDIQVFTWDLIPKFILIVRLLTGTGNWSLIPKTAPSGEQIPPIESMRKMMPENDLWPISNSWNIRLHKAFFPDARTAWNQGTGNLKAFWNTLLNRRSCSTKQQELCLKHLPEINTGQVESYTGCITQPGLHCTGSCTIITSPRTEPFTERKKHAKCYIYNIPMMMVERRNTFTGH